MILKITRLGTDYYIDTDIILYGYDDTDLKLVLSQTGINYTPAAEIFENNSVNTVTVPTYADFVTDTAGSHFLEMASTEWGVINVNLLKIQSLELIDSSNTIVRFSKYNSVNVNVAIATIQAAINAALTGKQTIIATAGVDINDVAGKAFLICWGNMLMTEGWTQAGSTISFTDGTKFGGGETIKIIFE